MRQAAPMSQCIFFVARAAQVCAHLSTAVVRGRLTLYTTTNK